MARIYISSTREDLQTEREAAAKAVRRLGHQAIYMEEYVASNLSPLEKCLQDVKSCDVYVGIFAFRYGFIPVGQKKSITHLEYEAAVKAGIPCLIFIMDPNAPHMVKFVSTGDERQKIDHLRQELGEKYVVSFFKNAEELGRLVGAAVSKTKLHQKEMVMPPPYSPQKNNDVEPVQPTPVKPMLKKDRKAHPVVPWLVGVIAVLVVVFTWVMINKVEKQTPTEISILAAYGVPYEMVEIPGGEFQMGSKNGYDNEKPVHTVLVSGFRIGKTEVTQGLWKAVMGNNPSYFKNGDDYPVENVSWHDCQEFLNRLNQKTGGNYRLPYEAEWEYACRAGTVGDYYGPVDAIAWYKNNSNKSTHPVGQKKQNDFGLYDMLGNVWEWCWDWYGSYDGSYQMDPMGPVSGDPRVGRGGGWSENSKNVQSAHRDGSDPRSYENFLGFRISQSISSPASKKHKSSK